MPKQKSLNLSPDWFASPLKSKKQADASVAFLTKMYETITYSNDWQSYYDNLPQSVCGTDVSSQSSQIAQNDTKKSLTGLSQKSSGHPLVEVRESEAIEEAQIDWDEVEADREWQRLGMPF